MNHVRLALAPANLDSCERMRAMLNATQRLSHWRSRAEFDISRLYLAPGGERMMRNEPTVESPFDPKSVVCRTACA
jgi:hypothetical protein